MTGAWIPQRLLGEGATALVHHAVHRDTGKPAALKVLKTGLDEESARRMEREVRIIASLHHPNILPVIEHGTTEDGRPWLAMPVLDGTTLRDHATTRDDAWNLLRPIALALSAAHQAGVIHRDVKPENILVDKKGQPRLIDFGLARRAEDLKLTQTGTPLGTPRYMPPEQWWNQPVTPASDQYALGVILFELLAGHPPFSDNSYAALLQSHLTAPVPLLPGAIGPVLQRALSKDPADRFPSMEAFIGAVDGALGVRRKDPVLPALGALLAMPLLMVVHGYAGEHDPRILSMLAGWGVYPTVALYLLAIPLLGKRAGALPSIAVAIGAFGTLGTFTGWHAVLDAVQRHDVGKHFEILHEGMFEANINRALGFGLAGAVVVAALLRPAQCSRRKSESFSAAVMLGLLGIGLLLASQFDAAWVALAGALVHLASPPVHNRLEALRVGALRLWALGLIAASAYARSEGTSARLWSLTLTRAERALAVMVAHQDQRVLLTSAAITVAVSMVVLVQTLRRHPRGPVALPRRAFLVVGAALLWSVTDVGVMTWSTTHRREAWNGLAPVFASFLRLQPPRHDGLPAPAVAPCLRLAQDVVGVDAHRVGLTTALLSPEGVTALAQDLSHRLAREDVDLQAPVQLLVMVDKDVPWRAVRRALGVAYGLGVRRVQLLYSRGEPLVLPASAPPESAYALPRDFGAAEALLSDGAGITLADDAPFAALEPGAAPLQLRVER